MASQCNALLVSPRFMGPSYFDVTATCEFVGARAPAPPLGLLTVAALLPATWNCKLVNRNSADLSTSDLDWADIVMIGGMLPQRLDALEVVALAQSRGKPVVVGGPDVTSSPEAYEAADFRVLGEAEGIIDEFVDAWESGVRKGLFEAAKFSADVTTTPLPRFDLVNHRDYLYFGIQHARGCPFKCEFCDIIELYGRTPRVKTPAQMFAELDALYERGYRGHIDFVDDNFIGNKKAIKAFLPLLIEWQKERGYPFWLSTEASVNLADDDALLALMREAGFSMVFVGIESPDPDTLVAMQKKQNTRRSLADSVHKIYRAGMAVHGGFIVGFDTERGSVAEAIIDCIKATSIPVCSAGLLYALPLTQLASRLRREGRLHPPLSRENYLVGDDKGGDMCTNGLNFETLRPRRDILGDYRKVVASIYAPGAYFARVGHLMRVLDRPVLDRSNRKDPPRRRIFGITPTDARSLWRLTVRLARQDPKALWHFAKVFYDCARRNHRLLEFVGIYGGLYLHLGPFSRFVLAAIDRQIAEIEIGKWQSPISTPVPPVRVADLQSA